MYICHVLEKFVIRKAVLMYLKYICVYLCSYQIHSVRINDCFVVVVFSIVFIEKFNIKFVPAEARAGLLTAEENARLKKLHEENKHFLKIPRR